MGILELIHMFGTIFCVLFTVYELLLHVMYVLIQSLVLQSLYSKINSDDK
jgi:hypothetical protein